jgi:hypothetical protein
MNTSSFCPHCNREDFIDHKILQTSNQIITSNVSCKFCMGPIRLSYKTKLEIISINKDDFQYDDFGRPTSKSIDVKSNNICNLCNQKVKNCSCKKMSISLKYSDVEDVIVGAFEGGINDWLYFDEKLNKDLIFLNGLPFSINIVRNLYLGKSVILSDSEDHAFTGELTLEKLEKAIITGETDIEDMDALDYDKIIQIATFGSIVFG